MPRSVTAAKGWFCILRPRPSDLFRVRNISASLLSPVYCSKTETYERGTIKFPDYFAFLKREKLSAPMPSLMSGLNDDA